MCLLDLILVLPFLSPTWRSFHNISKRSNCSPSCPATTGGAIEVGVFGIPKAIDACSPYTKTPSELPRPVHIAGHQQTEPSSNMFGYYGRTSDRIPNLSFRRSIQTSPPDLRKRIASVVETRDIRDTEPGRTYVSLWYDIHVDNGDRASEICAYDFDELPRDRAGRREQLPAVYFIGVRTTSKSYIALRLRGTNSILLLPYRLMSTCSSSSAALQLLMKLLGTGFSNPSQEATLAEHITNVFDVSPIKEMLEAEVLLTRSVDRVLLSGGFVAMHVRNPNRITTLNIEIALMLPIMHSSL